MTSKKTWMTAGAIALAGWLLGGSKAYANTADLDLDVTITQNLSVAVTGSGVYASTVAAGTFIAGSSTVSFSTVAVVNDSGGSTERWELSAANAIPTGGESIVWDNAQSTTSIGADEFGLQAVFGSSATAVGHCPIASSSTWNASYAAAIQTTPNDYTNTLYANPNMVDGNGAYLPDGSTPDQGEMFAGDQRALCYKILYPPSTTAGNGVELIQLAVTAQVP